MTDTTNQKFDPVKEFIAIRDNLTRTLSQSLRLATDEAETTFPAINMYETEDAVIVRTQAITGVSAASLDVAVEDGVLTISGEIAPDETETSLNYLIQEIRVGSFSRQILMPHPVNAENAEASLKQGVLHIRLPKQ